MSYENKYPHLLTPLKVGSKFYKNRLLGGPAGNHATQGLELYPTDRTIAYYAERARGGAAQVTVGAFQATGGWSPTDFVHIRWCLEELKKPCNMRYFRKLTDAIHAENCLAALESGYGNHFDANGVALGVVDGVNPMSGKPIRMMQESDMDEIANFYADMAEALVLAGFDSTVFMCAHGMGWADWYNSNRNTRTDKFGGDAEGRARFPKLVFQRMKDRVGDKLNIEYRISGYEFEPHSPPVFETIEHVKQLEDVIDLIHFSAGYNANPSLRAITHPSGFLNQGTNSFPAKAAKEANVRVPVVTIGGFYSPDVIESTLANGTADFVATTRAIIAEPELIKKIREGRADEARPCVRCFRCLDGYKTDVEFSCSVNPEAGRELDTKLFTRAPERVKNCAVIGGGPAGMQCALTLAGRGHKVTIYEKTNSLGGNLKFSDYVSFKKDLRAFKDWMIHMVEKNENISVEFGVEASPEFIREQGYDAVFAALGAVSAVPPIPGVDSEKVILATDAYNNPAVGKKVVVIGGGQVGCETGLYLGLAGKDVTIIEMLGKLAPDAIPTHRTPLIAKLDEWTKYSVNTRCVSIDEQGVHAVCDGEEVLFEADTVILSAGMRPLTADAEAYWGSAFDVSFIGDCVKAKTIAHATRTGFDAAMRT